MGRVGAGHRTLADRELERVSAIRVDFSISCDSFCSTRFVYHMLALSPASLEALFTHAPTFCPLGSARCSHTQWHTHTRSPSLHTRPYFFEATPRLIDRFSPKWLPGEVLSRVARRVGPLRAASLRTALSGAELGGPAGFEVRWHVAALWLE